MSICLSWPLVIGSPETDVNTRCKQHPRELRWDPPYTTNLLIALIILKMEMISVGSFICLLVYPITWYNTLVIPNVIMMQLIHLSVFYLNDQLNCMASPFPDFIMKVWVWFCYLLTIYSKAKHFPNCLSASSQNTAWKKGFICIFSAVSPVWQH